MTSEALTTRLTRKRLASLKKYVPLRDHVRVKLQHRQETQTDFSIGREELFSPVTKATKDMKLATERAIWGEIPDLEKDPTKKPRKETPLIDVLKDISTATEKTQEGIKQLSSELQTQREIQQMGGIDIDDIQPIGDTDDGFNIEQEELLEELEEPQGATGGKTYLHRMQ